MPATLPANPDVVVIGAGAAGIAAARRLLAAGRSVVVLEAGRRIGGRACTDTQAFGTPYDLGAAWLQGPANMPHIRYARRRGFTLVDHASPADTLFIGDRRATATERRRYAGTVERIGSAIARAGDVAVAHCVDTTAPFAGAALAWLGALDHAVDYTELSTADVNALGPREANYLVREGVGTLIAGFGARLPVRLGVAATCIRWGGRDVRIETDVAGTLRTRACIVTVSTGVLAAGNLQFVPALPAWKTDAITHLPMGLLAKVALQFDGERFGLRRNTWLTCDVPARAPTEACFFLCFPHGSNLLVGFVGGRFGWRLSAAGADAAIAHALDVLAGCLGSRVRRHFVRGHLTDWATNPRTLGAYAAATPGQHAARAALARPLRGRLFFAGEATHPEYFALVAGAHRSGEAAALDALAAIG